MAKSHRENDDCGFGVPLFSGRGHLWISQAKSDTLQNQRACCYMCRRKLDYPCRAIVPPIEVKPQWLRVKKVAHKFRSTKGSGFPPSTPSWAERFMLCLYDLRWSVLVPLKTFSKQESWETNLKINGCPSCSPMRKLPWIWMWYLRDVGRILYKENYPEMGSFMKFQCIIYPDENYPTNSMVSHGGQAPKPGAWEVLLG